MEFDKDLQSIQEVRNLVAKAKAAQAEFATFSQERVDAVVKAIAQACEKEAERLAKMAVEETGFGIWQDKVLKNPPRCKRRRRNTAASCRASLARSL